MRYDIVLFDADGTLFDFHKSEYEAVKEMFESFGIKADDELVADYSKINDSLWKMLERGEIEKEVLLYRRFELVCEKHSFDADARLMAKTYMENLSQKAYLLEGAEDLCKKLYGKVKIYIVTNGVEFIQKSRYTKSGLDKYFERVFISGEIGFEKPSVEYFEHVASNIPDFDKSRALIVGDSLTSDIMGGINYGIDTCWYSPNGKKAPEGMDITHISTDFSDIYKFITQESE